MKFEIVNSSLINCGFEFFFGAWSQNPIEIVEKSKNDFYLSRGGQRENFFFLSSLNKTSSADKSLYNIYDTSADLNALMFRGYILNDSIHSYSCREKLYKYWSEFSLNDRHNGVFSAALITNNASKLTLVSDAFGIGSIYYRLFRNVVFFSSSPRFLKMEGDSDNLIAWRTLIQVGFVPGDDSLTEGILRVPPGSYLSFSENRLVKQRWYHFTSLPCGERSIGNKEINENIDCFNQSMDRCLKLNTEENYLPLSSGYDSRRFLAYFLERKIQFKSKTIKRIDAQGRDIDAYFSNKMAEEFNFNHTIPELKSGRFYQEAEDVGRRILDYESSMHSWSLPLWDQPNKVTSVFDGLCGDTLGHSGLKIFCFGNDYKVDPEWIVSRLMTDTFESVFNSNYWPHIEEVRANLIGKIRQIPINSILADIFVILHRARRSISISSQQFSKPGHIVIYPYLDLDYVETCLKISPLSRYENSLQARSLKKSYPQIFNFPGSNNIPAYISFNSIPVDKDRGMSLLRGQLNYVLKNNNKLLIKSLKFRRYVMLFTRAINKNKWWLRPYLEYCHKNTEKTLPLIKCI